MGALQHDSAVAGAEGRYVATLSRDWEIWGPNGGYVAAIALRAAGAAAPDDHWPATLTVQYVGVAKFGEIEAEVTPIKQGRSAWLLNVALIQDGRVFLQAQVWTTNRVDGPMNTDAAMPDLPRPEALKFFHELMPTDAPPRGFWMNFDVKPVGFVPQAERQPGPATLQEWYRFTDFDAGGDAFLDCARAVILIDTMIWPTHHRGLAERPDYIAPSLDLTVWFHQPPTDAVWLLADVAADHAGRGLIHGRSRIWAEDGRLIATGGSNMLHTQRR